MRATLKRGEIVRGREAFQRALRQGKRIHGKYLRCSVLAETGEESGTESRRSPVKFGVAVSRGVKRAVDRNRVKRLVREGYRKNKHILLSMTEPLQNRFVVLFYYSRPAASHEALPSFEELESEVRVLLERARPLIGQPC